MADYTVIRGYVARLGGTVVAVSTVSVSQSCMQCIHNMAGEALISNVVKGERGGSCRGPCFTLGMADKTFGPHIRIMIIGQITRARISQGMTCHAIICPYRSSMSMTLDAIRMPWIIMQVLHVTFQTKINMPGGRGSALKVTGSTVGVGAMIID